ncbi:MAG: undecaprenyl-phosphate glucose phosphotransferase [Caldilineales bacterium]|nr:undecaprenyl-phosphate glucose phosphotransferase [Caldilineales bacterium]
MKRTRFIFQVATLFGDLTAATLAVFVAHRLQRALRPGSVDRFLVYLPYLLVLLAAIVLVFFFTKRYHRRRPESLIDSISVTAWAVTVAWLMSLTAVYFFANQESNLLSRQMPRGFVLGVWALTILFIGVSRYVLARVFMFFQSHGYGRDRVLVVGTGDVGRMLVQKLESTSGVGHEVIGFVETNSDNPTMVGVPVLGRPADLPKVIEEYAVDEVVIGVPEASHRQLVNLIALCEREKVSIKVFPDVFQIMATEVRVSDLAGLPLLTIRDVALRGWRLSLKRIFDLVFSVLGLIFLSPLMLLIALLVKLESPGPVFYIQERMGLDARPFPMLKFRSMRTDAEQTGPGWTTENDPRKTRLGSLLRKISIDELPQLINVVRGDMSLVGPRPERPVYVEQFRQYIPRYMDRHREKAGMTGWAQINGLRGDTSIVERTKYDLWYIENWSIWLDFKICFRTILSMFGDRNAY